MQTSQTILLKKRPKGKPSLDDFEFTHTEIPTLKEGEVLLKSLYLSVDPYLRGRMSNAPSYIAPFEVGQPIESGIVAEVLESKAEAYRAGDYVFGALAWKEVQVTKARSLTKVDPKVAPLSAYLGVLGLTGLTAYLGMMEIGKPKKGETLLVSGAAGAVGSIVGQIGKIFGMHVVGIAGSDEKLALMQSKFGFDAGINYKTTENMREAIAKACPTGVDVYFDNVGGEISEAVLFNINKFSRTINCGAISVYNTTEAPKSICVQSFLVKKSSLMQGFVVFDYADKHPAAIQQLAAWMKEGKLTYTETIREGFNQVPQAFLDLFEGLNQGKMVVKL